jgi:thiol:disulfide interchange protein
VIASLAALFTLLALNLAGLFEFGNLLPAGLAARQLQNPTLNAALSGVLAAVVASPCTAPFMGASLGLALTLPAWQAMGVFAMLGLGMALPFLVATWVPALARSLPRPGAWMQTFRQLMAFPMLATVVWLVWVLGQQSGVDGAGALLVLLVALGFVVWSLGLPGRARWLLGGTAALGLAAVLFHWGPLIVAPAAAEAPVRSGERWQTWSAPAVAQQLAQGKTVFVDFTAAWCVTCQVNKKTTLGQARVLAAFDSDGVVAMRADWTRRDPAITAALRQLGRSGVPVYVVYHPGQAPKILSEIIHVDEVLAALRRG